MDKWLICIVGVVFLGVLLDLLYPNGKTNAFCKSIFGVFAVYTIINPLFNIDLDTDISTSFVETSLSFNINSAKKDAVKLEIEKVLVDANIVGIDVEIEAKLYNDIFEIENVFIDTTNLVLTENITNINKYEVITNEVLKAIQIDKERIIIYG